MTPTIKAVIPAKASSTRVPDKNFRPFHGTRSLLDIKVGQLLTVLPAEQIYVSSEEPACAAHAERLGINFLSRAPELARNETPYASVVSQICRDTPGDDDIMWCHVTDPLFDQYAECLARWREARDHNDALVVVYPRQMYLLDHDHRPMGFGFGPWHRPSQTLPMHYQLGFTLSILRRSTATTLGPIGANPYWFDAANQPVDIDTEDDFRMAQAIYAYLHEQDPARAAAR
ncbi:hypothetical protein [Polymorphospora sp. NPDC050346]|uniref:cytidylyltransferase domain-containing protein n=1 Tax=Polymorphospora sp. NPDC050346 TaxID=3155780 RepID=UPI0033F1D250